MGQSLHAKTAFITGGNDGIGLTTAKLFAAQGFNVAIVGRRADRNKHARSAIEAQGGRCLTIAGDVSRADDVERAVNETVEHFGRLDYAFNNAGIEQAPKSCIDLSEEEFDASFATNVKGAWLCMKYEIPHLLTRGGAIVNNASASGLVGTAGMAFYTATKHALIGLTKSVALDYAADGIRINAVAPGAVKTETYRSFIEKDAQFKAMVEGAHPMGRIASTEEVAAAVLYLCRDATFTTGTALAVDGGFTAQ